MRLKNIQIGQVLTWTQHRGFYPANAYEVIGIDENRPFPIRIRHLAAAPGDAYWALPRELAGPLEVEERLL